MKARKILTLLGKFLMIVALMWPIPMGYILYPLIGWQVDMPMWGIKPGYWWPLLGPFVAGLLMCLVTRYKANQLSYESVHKLQVGRLLFKLIGWSVLIVLVFIVVSLLIAGFHYLFFTDMFEYSAPALFCIIALIAIIVFGVAYYNNYDSSKHENLDEQMASYREAREQWKQKELEKEHRLEERRNASKQRKKHWTNIDN